MDFTDALKEKRPHLSVNSLKTYNSCLRTIYKNCFPTDKEADPAKFSTEHKKVSEYINSKPFNVRKTILASLVCIAPDVKDYKENMISDIKEYKEEIDKQEESEQANLGADQAERLAIESSAGDQQAGALPAGATDLILRELDAMDEASREDGGVSHAKEGVGAVPATGFEAERDLLNSPSGAAAQNGPDALPIAGGDAARFREARGSAQRAHDGSAGGVEHSPKEAIVVQVLGEPMNASGQVSEAEPMFDAAAELAAMRFGLGPVGMAVEVVAAIDAAQAPANAPKQRVHMGQAQRSS